MLKFLLYYLIIASFSNIIFAQEPYIITGIVLGEGGMPLPAVSVFQPQSKRGTITNSEGRFSFIINRGENELFISHIGYETFIQEISPKTGKLQIQLKTLPYQIPDIVISNVSAESIFKLAIKKIPDNYEQTPFLTKAYYRAKASENDTIVYMEETAFEIIKSYQSGFEDKYFLVKNRNIRFNEDKTNWRQIGQYDYVSNAPRIFNANFFRSHTISFLPATTFDNRSVYVLSVTSGNNDNKYNGEIYIDMDDMAFIYINLRILNAGEKQAQYKKIDGNYYLINGHSIMINKISGRTLPAESNMITTDIIHTFSKEDIQGIPVTTEDYLEVYATQQEDTLFWKEHNTILPDSALREAINRLEQMPQNIVNEVDTASNSFLKRLFTPNISIIASSDWTKDFSSFNYNSISISHLADYYIHKRFQRNSFMPILTSSIYYFLSMPFESVLEEKMLLNIHGLNPKINPFYLNRYNVSYLHSINKEMMAGFKNSHYSEFMRLHTIRQDGHYTKALLLEEEIAKVDLSNKNNKFNVIHYYTLPIYYHRISNIYIPNKSNIKYQNFKEEKQPLIIDKDRSWVHSLFNSEADFQRHVQKDDLTSEEQKFLKHSGWFSMINFLSPQMIGISKFRLNKNNDFTFSLDYLRVPFGEMFSQNIWVMHKKKQLHGLFLKQYKTYEKTTLGVGYKLYDFKLFSNMYVNTTLNGWSQPVNLKFKDTSSKIGFHIGQLYEYQFLPDKYKEMNNMSIFLGYDYKTQGYMPQSFFTSKNFDLKLGFKWIF